MSCSNCGLTIMITNRGTCCSCEKLFDRKNLRLNRNQCDKCGSYDMTHSECNPCRRAEARKNPCSICKGYIDINNEKLHELCETCNEKAENYYKNEDQ